MEHRAPDGGAPRLLVVTDVTLASADPGAIFLRALLAGYPRDRLAVCEVRPEAHPTPTELAGVASLTVELPRERGLHRLGRWVHRATRWAFEERLRRSEVPRVVREIVAFGREAAAERVLVVLNGTTVICAAPRVAGELGVPLLTLVWDPPEYRLAEAWGLRGALLDRYLADFEAAIRASARCAVMSEGMRDEFVRRYGVDTVLIRRGIPREQWRAADPRPMSGTEFVIGYAGNLYARDEWDAFIAALDRLGWRAGGRQIRVRVLSWSFEARAQGPVCYEFRGWQTPEQALDALAETDLCYLPYWFADRYADVVRMSFPSKLSSYVAAGVPVFYHGPERSSPAVFMTRFPVGARCHSLDPAVIAPALDACASDPGFRQRSIDAGRRALEQELGLDVMSERFRALVGATRDAIEGPAVEGAASKDAMT